MDLISKDSILQDIPLFSNLSTAEQSLIKKRSSLQEFKKGQIIYKEASAADAFYCIILGRVVIYNLDVYGNELTLEYLHRGKYFGIISLLTGEPHSVNARALNDCLILVIKKEDFDFVLNKIPRLAIDLSQTLSRRLKRKDIHLKTIFESTIISVFSSYSPVGKTIYSLNLGLSFKQETHKSVIILDIAAKDKMHSLPNKLDIEGNYRIFDLSGIVDTTRILRDFILATKFDVNLICLHYQPEDESFVKKMIDILSLLVNDYHYIILDLPSVMDTSIFAVLNQSDLIHILSSPEPVDLGKTHNLIERLKTDFNFQESKIKVIINEYKLSKLDHEQQVELLNHDIFATLPRIEFKASDRLVLDEPACEYARAIRRVSRQLGERMVGLVLGVGVAYGLCHIGVLKVIEEEKIPIDVIAGSSIGALLASLWVTGRTAGEILEITKEFRQPKDIWSMVDLTFPWRGFIKGNKLYNFLKKHLGNKTFYDVKLPLKIIASDIKKKESKVLDKGPLVDALMASCAMPGVFMPFKFREEMLFDGGVINPLPTEPLFRIGVKKIIAVNVTPSREDILKQYEKIKQVSTKIQINILDAIFGSIEILQSEVAKKEAQLADIVLHPDTQGLYWLELHRSCEFAKRGEEETRRNLDRIWQVINE